VLPTLFVRISILSFILYNQRKSAMLYSVTKVVPISVKYVCMSIRALFIIVLIMLARSVATAADREDSLANEQLQFIYGDFDGDGRKDTGMLLPVLTDSFGNCSPDCSTYIWFSGKIIPDLVIDNGVDVILQTIKDLDNNKTDEIGLYIGELRSNWSHYKVYTLRNHRWVYLVPPMVSSYLLDKN
jgi:hypothetical protein